MKTRKVIGALAAAVVACAGLAISQPPTPDQLQKGKANLKKTSETVRAPETSTKIETIKTAGMFTIKFDNTDPDVPLFTQEEKNTIVAACKTALADFKAENTASKEKKAELMKEWFGTVSAEQIQKGTDTLDALFKDPEKSVTFIDMRQNANERLARAYAYVFLLPEFKAKGSAVDEKTPASVGSGSRIFLAQAFFTGPKAEQPQTVIHELAHKILGKSDLTVNYKGQSRTAYGTTLGRLIAQRPEDHPFDNADNWGYYLTSFGAPWPK